MTQEEKKTESCGNCVFCDKTAEGTDEEVWICEECYYGMTVRCDPPYDKACRHYLKSRRKS